MKPSPKKSHKSFIRKRLRSKLARISPALRRQKSQTVCKELEQTDFLREAQRVLIYAARKDELDTRPLIRRLLKQGKTVFLPRVTSQGIRLYRIRHLKNDLRPGIYGILEPRPLKARLGEIRHIDVAVIPGLGFTRDGVRLGRGGGHFDRLLERAGHVIRIGVGFREQLLKKIPQERHDVRMHWVITD